MLLDKNMNNNGWCTIFVDGKLVVEDKTLWEMY
jgi:hypothetical protein